jgi:hypothetical protein
MAYELEHKSPTSITNSSPASSSSSLSSSNNSNVSNQNAPDAPAKYRKAYMIYGHGYDRARRFEVPPNCYIVAIAELGTTMPGLQYMDNIQTLCELHKKYPDLLGNPAAYITQLRHALRKKTGKTQTIIIYGPGDLCHNFNYHLTHYPSDGQAGVKCINDPDKNVCDFIPLMTRFKDQRRMQENQKRIHSKLVKSYPVVRDKINQYIGTHVRDNERVSVFPDNKPHFDKIHLYICSQYLHSEWPSLIDIFNDIEFAIYRIIKEEYENNDSLDPDKNNPDKRSYLKANHKDIDVGVINIYSFENAYVSEYLKRAGIMNMIMEKLKDKWTITQNSLCDIMNQLYPGGGVYYNFVCRVRHETKYVDPPENQPYNDKLFTAQQLLRPNVTHVKNVQYSPNTRQVLLNRIAEAEKRKRIQKLYYDSDLYKEWRKKQNKELLRNGLPGPGVLHKRITQRKETVRAYIRRTERERNSFPATNKQRDRKIATRNRRIAEFQKELADLERTEKQIADNYENFVRHYTQKSPNSNYVKLKSRVKGPANRKWITRKSALNRGLTNANYNEPVVRSAKPY